MRLAGRIWKDGESWLAEVPMLDALTQERSRPRAFRMMADLVETMADKKGFRVAIFPGARGAFEIGSGDAAALVAVMLRRQREKRGLSLSEVARRLGSSSKTAYARYEQGRSVPTVEKLFGLLSAVAPGEDFVFHPGRGRGWSVEAGGPSRLRRGPKDERWGRVPPWAFGDGAAFAVALETRKPAG